ncbi:hypothetical protein [Streptomyces cucumeris]|uniref:hypothetical protein n=1 Tax=Streptomyces cucumeris TaxID=2962890 RepID=UPI0020C835F1|nr:hypothetical protein [Streptomyces sp. NEAU-Y11]MCP9207053.1 hypothetical protein [Streptomyces sp. NEAU-Y11]
MTGDHSCVTLERLRAIDWSDDSAAFDHANSRALLMREYLRRTALWAQAYDVEDTWPFFDVAEHVAPQVQLAPELTAELDEVLTGVMPSSLKRMCRAAVRWAVVRQSGIDLPKGLPDEPYEPLLLMCERGGGYFVEEFVDLNGAMIQLGSVERNLAATPFIALAHTTLDALDAEGEITYYAKVSDDYPRVSPLGVVRRRIDDTETYDEAFTADLRWEPTEYLRLRDLGRENIEHVVITEAEAAAFIESTTKRGGTLE